uniref:Mucin-5AC-like n=1 Tax=Haemonchus contortus TaxID=6289 RepID=A0A7I4YLL4_HAECO
MTSRQPPPPSSSTQKATDVTTMSRTDTIPETSPFGRTTLTTMTHDLQSSDVSNMETVKTQTESKKVEEKTSTVTTKISTARESSHPFIHQAVVTPTAVTQITSEHPSAPSLSLHATGESTRKKLTTMETTKYPNLSQVSREEQTTHLPRVDRRSQTQLLPSTASNETTITSLRGSTSFHPSASPIVSRTNTSAATVSPYEDESITSGTEQLNSTSAGTKSAPSIMIFPFRGLHLLGREETSVAARNNTESSTFSSPVSSTLPSATEHSSLIAKEETTSNTSLLLPMEAPTTGTSRTIQLSTASAETKIAPSIMSSSSKGLHLPEREESQLATQNSIETSTLTSPPLHHRTIIF